MGLHRTGQDMTRESSLVSRGTGQVTFPLHVPIKAINGLEAHRTSIRQLPKRGITPLGLHMPNLTKSGDRSSDHIQEAMVERLAKAALTHIGLSFQRSLIVAKWPHVVRPFALT